MLRFGFAKFFDSDYIMISSLYKYNYRSGHFDLFRWFGCIVTSFCAAFLSRIGQDSGRMQYGLHASRF